MLQRGLFVVLGLAAGCGVGDEGGLDGTSDDRDETLGILCNAMYDLTGSFAAGTPARPSDTPTGCWPVGTWTFTATMTSNECAAAPAQLQGSYAFRVDRTMMADGWYETYEFLGDAALLYKVGVSEGGGGECQGGLELYSVDGTEYWNFKPAQTGPTIVGFAEYARYDSDQR